MKKRILAALLTTLMALSLLPVSAMAAGDGRETPSIEDIGVLFQHDIAVRCYFEPGQVSNEVERVYPFPLSTEFTCSQVENNRVSVTLDTDPYVSLYSSFFEDQTGWGHFAHVNLMPRQHTLNFDLVWNEETDSWAFADGAEPEIAVRHVQPDFGTVQDTIGQNIQVVCADGEIQKFAPLVDSTVYWQKDRPRRTTYQGQEAVSMTVELDKGAYVRAFSESYGPHTLAGGQDQTYVLTLYYINNGSDKWVLREGTEIDPIRVVPAAPEAPSGAALDALLGEVTLTCANGHQDRSYKVSDVSGGCTMGQVTQGAGYTWTCAVTVHAAPFVEEYNACSREEHLLAEDADSKTVVLTYDNANGWVSSEEDLSFQVVCPHPHVDAIQVRMSPEVQALYDDLGGWFNARWTHVDNTKSLKGYYEMGENQWNDNIYCITAAEVTGVTIGDRCTKYWFPMNEDNGQYARLKVSYEYMYSPVDVFHIFGKQYTMILECDLVNE